VSTVSKIAGKASIFVAASLVAISLATAANAAQTVVNVGTTFTAAGLPISFDGSTFTFFASGDFFSPTAVQTSGGAAFRTVLDGVSTDFPQRGSGIISYGPDNTFAAVPTKTTVPYSNGDNYFGLRATLNGQNYYGYAYTTNNVLNSYGYQTIADTPFVIDTNAPAAPVPEPASWAMMIGGFGMVGAGMRRRRVAVSFA
jgi:hypothetical protein